MFSFVIRPCVRELLELQVINNPVGVLAKFIVIH